MAQLLDGEESALDTLVERYQKPLFCFASRLLSSESLAEDAFQETFIKVFRRRWSYQKEARFKPWVYQICLNVCRDMLRKNNRRKEVPLDKTYQVRDPNPGPAEVVQRSAESLRVQVAVSQLPVKQREVLILSHFQGLTHEEISTILNVPPGTAKSRKFTALKSLAEILKK